MSKYPKLLYLKQTHVLTGSVRYAQQPIKNYKEENAFRQQAASMAPNFTNEISETPFDKE